MNGKKNLNNLETTLKSYKNNMLCVEKLLKEYTSEDKIYLFSENKRLQEKIKNFEVMLSKATASTEETHQGFEEDSVNYFEKIEIELWDFLIILKWNNFSAIPEKLRSMCKNSTMSFSERKNYNSLLHRLHTVDCLSNPNIWIRNQDVCSGGNRFSS
jgi:hypothetical protein